MKATKTRMMVAMTMAAMVAVSGCASKGEGTANNNSAEDKAFKIGITQIVDHKALNDAKEGFKERLNELGIQGQIDEKNAQGDVSNAHLIATGFVTDQVDLILAIATPSVQSAQNATKEKEIPVVFTAVSDPVEAGIVKTLENGEGNITGVTDAVTKESIAKLLQILRTIKLDAKAIGVIYNTGEANSISQIKTLKLAAEESQLQLIEVGINEITSIDPAIETIKSKADALFLINDNMIASSMELISEKAKSNQLITLSADSSHVEKGALISLGISYKELGRQAADMAKRILVDKEKPGSIAIESSNNLTKIVNETTAKALGLSLEQEMFKDATMMS